MGHMTNFWLAFNEKKSCQLLPQKINYDTPLRLSHQEKEQIIIFSCISVTLLPCLDNVSIVKIQGPLSLILSWLIFSSHLVTSASQTFISKKIHVHLRYLSTMRMTIPYDNEVRYNYLNVIHPTVAFVCLCLPFLDLKRTVSEWPIWRLMQKQVTRRSSGYVICTSVLWFWVVGHSAVIYCHSERL